MDFLWPQALWLLLAVPALVVLYALILRRRARVAMRYASVALIRGSLSRGQRLRRRHRRNRQAPPQPHHRPRRKVGQRVQA